MNRRVLFGNCASIVNLFASLPSIKYLARVNPEISFYLPLDKKDIWMQPIFNNLSYLDGVFIIEDINHFSTELDNINTKLMKFVNVLNPKQEFKDNEWWKSKHLTQELYYSYFNQIPLEFDSKFELNKYYNTNITDLNLVAFVCNIMNIDKIRNISFLLKKMGFNVIFLDRRHVSSIHFTDIEDILSCRFLITDDPRYIWAVAGGYDFPTIGLYSNKGYGKKNMRNITPICNNSIYLNNFDIDMIKMEEIEVAIKQLIQ